MTSSLKSPGARSSHVATIEGHSERAWSVRWHPHLPVLASCSSDKSIRLSLFTPDMIFSPSSALPLAHTRTIRHLAFNKTGTVLVSASFDSTVGIWQLSQDFEDERIDWLDWECISTLEGHENEVKSVAWSADGSLLATCGRDKSVWIWDASEFVLGGGEFECLAVLMDHTQDVKAVTWHPTLEILCSASYDDTLRIYQPDLASDDWSCTHVLPPLSSHTHALAAQSGQPIAFHRTGHDSTVWSASFSPDGMHLASASQDSTIRIWQRRLLTDEELPDRTKVYRIGPADKERWTCVGLFKDDSVFQRAIYSIDWAPSISSNGSLGYIAAAGSDGTIAVLAVVRSFSTDNSIWLSRQSLNQDTGSDKPVTIRLLDKIEEAHGISEINSVQWCRSRPKRQRRPATSDPDSDSYLEPDQRQQHIDGGLPLVDGDQKWQDRWAKATQGLLATAGDDGKISVWRFTLE